MLLNTIPPTPDVSISTPSPPLPVPVVTTAPVKVVVPVPAVWVILSASNARSAVTFAALTIVKSARSAVPPTMPSKSTFPAPAVKLRSCVPFNVLLNTILPALELIATAAVDKVVAPKVMPSKLLQFKPSSCTAPNRVVPTEPLARVTSSSNRTLVAAPAVKPEFAPTVS